jgi:hypothetical protein
LRVEVTVEKLGAVGARKHAASDWGEAKGGRNCAVFLESL